MLRNEEYHPSDVVIWFCKACGSANPIKRMECDGCNAPLTKECIIFNYEDFSGITPESAAFVAEEEDCRSYFGDHRKLFG